MGAACTVLASAGQDVQSNTDELNAQRKTLLQMLFVEGNHFCPSCEKSGDCLLQATAYEVGMEGPYFEELYPNRPVDASHPDVLLDLNRCILCSLCVRASATVDGKHVFAIDGHGIQTHLIVNSRNGVPPLHAPRKLKLATVSLAGCFGCHMSFLDIDERLLQLLELVEFDRSPLTDIKTLGHCDIGLIEGGLCNAENVQVLREFRANCKTLVAVGACAINGGLPAQRNQLDIGQILRDVYCTQTGLGTTSQIPNDPELPLPLNQVHPIHEVVHVDYFLPGCPPSGDAIWGFLNDLIAGRTPHLGHGLMQYD
jgi:NAD-reducing hydrogenase small subunit